MKKDNTKNSISQLMLALSIDKKITPRKLKEFIELTLNGDEKLHQSIHSYLNVSKEAWHKAERELEIATSNDFSYISALDEDYPLKLKEIADPPLGFFCQGSSELIEFQNRKKPFFAVIGTRRASPYGLKAAYAISKKITLAGGCVVSGLARGIDTAAHRGALEAAKNSPDLTAGIAVLGSGLLNIYPHENLQLVSEIASNRGLIISEYSCNTAPVNYHFPMRNRIVSGLVDAVIVIEAGEKSGAIITADLALEQGRDVFALPGQVDAFASKGTNSLLKSGAKFLTCFEDLKDYYPQLFQSIPKNEKYSLGNHSADKHTADNHCLEINNNPQLSPKNDGVEELKTFPQNYSTKISTSNELQRSSLQGNFSQEPLNNKQKSICEALSQEGVLYIETLVEMVLLDISEIRAELLLLEINGEVKSWPGDYYSLAE